MSNTGAQELTACSEAASRLAAEGESPEFEEPLSRLEEAAEKVAEAWSGSNLGYQSCVYYAGFKKHGFTGYIKHAALPPGVPVFIAPLIVFIELFTKFVFQPVSLALRVFAAMFAGHLILVLAVVAGEFLLFSGSALVIGAPFAFLAAIAFTFLEVLVMIVQAYVFALLAGVYIGAAVSTEH